MARLAPLRQQPMNPKDTNERYTNLARHEALSVGLHKAVSVGVHKVKYVGGKGRGAKSYLVKAA